MSRRVVSTSPSLEGKTVAFTNQGTRITGRVLKHDGDSVQVQLGVVLEDGTLAVGGAVVTKQASDVQADPMTVSERKLTAWQAHRPLLEEGYKANTIKDPAGVITDYQDVYISGYASTFAHITPADRDGDVILPGAFTATIAAFKQNPVMLINHRAAVENIAGSYTELREDQDGLRIVGKLSNSPDLRNVRFLVMEKHLRTLSIGGMFIFQPDKRTIEKVHLFEISLVAIPANPDATFQARSMDEECACKFVKMFSQP